ncbi:major facilitator superfamily domain-containing protein [Gilbertella persicaria]|uniref:major facilitator superfamily domain-containing protein n=1 Tax=Gilbertella persicaria TaxID=101096 RepID=UPI002220ACE9|nr:major facilitator superfamily domain-containing protein [Gilbertella persicaria]KAI8061547.1 major facilitator superfamily domain-containing protein [Gilbertella persicaria]
MSEKIESQVALKDDTESSVQANSFTEDCSVKNKISKNKKWFILLIVALQGFLGPLTSSIYVPAIDQVRQSFNASNTSINATISLYVFIMGLAPLLWASLSERHGRRTVYLLATILYVGSTIGCALSNSVGLFIALRAIQAVGASAAQAVGAGTITDLFDVHERGNAMGLFLLGPLVGPVVGPIAGGFINEYMNWQFIFWFLSAMGGLIFIFILFFLPETSVLILKRRALAKQVKETGTTVVQGTLQKQNDGKETFLESMARPFKFITKPLVIIATTPYSMAYGFMYFVIASLPHQLSIHYQFSSYQIGLSYLANGIGNALGAFISGKLSDRQLNKYSQINEKRTHLEARLPPMWIGIVLLPVGELVYGWCIQLNVHVMASLTGLFLLGLGVGFVQTPCNTYIVDSYQQHSASVMSVANLMRCISAGCTPLIAPTLIDQIGNGWSMTILAILSLLSGICIFLVQKYGERWRQPM